MTSGTSLLVTLQLVGFIDGIPWGEHDYFFTKKPKTFPSASEKCATKGGLASILSEDENTFITSYQNKEYWIGLTTNATNACSTCRAKWYWIDGSLVNYTNWNHDEPNNENSWCAHTSPDGFWYDYADCTEPKWQAVCKQPLCKLDSNDCGTNGNCSARNGTAWCDCNKGYHGKPCKEIDECNSNPCQNNGSCIDEIAEYTCNCSDGYGGVNCETDINECSSAPCQNGGTCDDLVNAFVCDCPTGYNGTSCENNLTPEEEEIKEDENESKALWIALYSGIIGCALSVIVLLYCLFTDHAVKSKLQTLFSSNKPGVESQIEVDTTSEQE